jgi:hypothetical protein
MNAFSISSGCGQFLNLIEAIELLDSISDFNFVRFKKKPSFSIYDKEKEGFVLCVKANLVNAEYRNFLGEIVKSRKLRMRELDGYLTISG